MSDNEEEARRFFAMIAEHLKDEPPIFSHTDVAVNSEWVAWYLATKDTSGHEVMAVATLKLMMARVGIDELIKQLYAQHEDEVQELIRINPEVWWILDLLEKPKPSLWQRFKQLLGAK